MMPYIYIITAPTLNSFKLGYSNKIETLTPRYRTPYGKNIDIRLFSCSNMGDEKSLHNEFGKLGYSMTGELYQLKHLQACIAHCHKKHGKSYNIALEPYVEPTVKKIESIVVKVETEKGPFPCQFCNAILSTKTNLTIHQKKTLKCLEIQHKGSLSKAEIKLNDALFECSACKGKFMTKFALTKHADICKAQDVMTSLTARIAEQDTALLLANQKIELANQKIELLSIQNQELKDQLAKKEQNQQHLVMAAITKPTTSVKNTIKNCVIQNLTPVIDSEMRDQAQYLTIDHVKAGAQGYAKYALEYPLKDKLACTDLSRKKLAWKDSEGAVVYDEEGKRLSEKFFYIFKEKNQCLVREIYNDLNNRLQDAYNRNDQIEADAIVELTGKISTWRSETLDTSKGKESDLGNDFVKYLCIASKT